ncbi:PREDICTED: ribonuclease P protein subunit p20-like [Acropora digitifera]|uniref:ribonuclease P protein subunit p20-like n=1 Tax=Acropora digitifera TaxID=70779 RepID=UPI00077AF839|nr:PREDICTED: ribonuclease P protein subunit p20-like [Acropora digitifera]
MEPERTTIGHAQVFDIDGRMVQRINENKMADKKSHKRSKRPPQRVQKCRNDIYVNRKTDFAVQLERCQKALDSSDQEVTIHGLGAAMNRAINLALQLEHKRQGTVELSATTSSVKLVDDYDPEDDDHEVCSKVRTNSAIHIKVYKKSMSEITSTSKGASKEV